MKKNTVYLITSVSLLVLVGIFLYVKFYVNGNSSKTVTVEVIQPLPSYNQDALNQVTDPSKAVDYVPDISLTNLGNSQPFGPLP